MVRRASTENFERIAHLRDRITCTRPICSTSFAGIDLIEAIRPNEVYNLAAHELRADELGSSRC